MSRLIDVGIYVPALNVSSKDVPFWLIRSHFVDPKYLNPMQTASKLTFE